MIFVDFGLAEAGIKASCASGLVIWVICRMRNRKAAAVWPLRKASSRCLSLSLTLSRAMVLARGPDGVRPGAGNQKKNAVNFAGKGEIRQGEMQNRKARTRTQSAKDREIATSTVC